MNLRKQWMALGLGLVTLAALNGCAVEGVGVSGGLGYDAGYYEPYGYSYGGWGRGYHVGPGRGGDRRAAHPAHAYRPAPASRRTPSIPNRARGHH